MDQQAVGGGGATAHPAAQLVQLGQPEALGVLDHHHTGLGHIHAHLHHRGAHQHLQLAGGEGPDRLLFVLAGQAAMQQAHLQLGKHPLLQILMHLHGRAQIELLRLLHQRQHHVGALAQAHLVADQLPGLLPFAVLQQAGADGGTPRRQLINLADLQIAMHRQGEGARDRRGGHRQQMGLQALGQQPVALAHSEAVLFIDHHQTEAIELHRVLQKGMGAHQQLQLAIDQVLQQLPSAACRCRAGEQGRGHPQLAEQGRQLAVVLLRQHLGGCHQGSLATGLHRGQQGCQGHQGLAAAHISLQQPSHRLGPGHVGPDLGQNPFLRTRQLERQQFPQPPAQGLFAIGRGQRWRRLAAQPQPPLSESELQQQELIKHQALPTGLQVFAVPRLVDAQARLRQREQPIALPQGFREGIGPVAHARQQRLNRPPQPLGREPFGEAVDGHQPADLLGADWGSRGVEHLDQRILEAGAVGAVAHKAADGHTAAAGKLALLGLEPAGVGEAPTQQKPADTHAARKVLQLQLQDRQVGIARAGEGVAAPHRRHHRGGAAGLERRDPHEMGVVEIVARIVLQKVAADQQTQTRQQGRGAWPDTLQLAERCVGAHPSGCAPLG